jgi:hypothetical protein
MTKQESLSFLDDLIAQSKAMSREDFLAREVSLGIDKIHFAPTEYLDTWRKTERFDPSGCGVETYQYSQTKVTYRSNSSCDPHNDNGTLALAA